MQDMIEATHKYGVFLPLGIVKEFAEDLGEALKIANQGGNPGENRTTVVEQVAKSRWARKFNSVCC